MSLIDRLQWRLPRLVARQKYSVLIDTTSSCNLRCSFCPRSNRAPHVMTPAEFDAILRKVRPRTGTLQLSCAWEFSVDRNAAEIIAILGRHRFPRTSIYSNGNILPEAVAEALVTAQISEYVVSFGEARPETYEKIRLGGQFDTVTGNMQRLAALKRERSAHLPRLCANLTLVNSNLGELPDFVLLAHSLGIEEIRGRHLILNQGLDMSGEMVTDPELANRIIRTAGERAAQLGLAFAIPLYGSAGEKKRCRAPWTQLYIASNGDVSVCPRIHTHVTVGNLLRDSLRTLEKSPALKALRREFTEGRFTNPVCAICLENGETRVPIDQGF